MPNGFRPIPSSIAFFDDALGNRDGIDDGECTMYFAHSEETARKVGRMPLTDFRVSLDYRRGVI